MSRALLSALALCAALLPAGYAWAQSSTTSPQAAPTIPPGETPPAAARTPGDGDAAPRRGSDAKSPPPPEPPMLPAQPRSGS